MVVTITTLLRTYIDVGCNGRISGGVLRNSSIFKQLENEILPDSTFLVGDDAFPLKKYLSKPFPGINATARRISENAFGILVSKFRVFEKPIPFNPNKIDKIVKACCAIRNWLRKDDKNYLQSGFVDMEDTENGTVIPGYGEVRITE
ncbi:hypothetical protein NQ317_017237 [Molorchus minor]|uniref:DDE Tnp4 domain-containing protein n=1 Tax=Molorchus minor TaxID=1323400 RepID=A0ABQ9JHR2_9CUCU|nr:hypothetical protein NQ317_017237 [Molorchus minor]